MELVNTILGGEMQGEPKDSSMRLRIAFKSGSNEDKARLKLTVQAVVTREYKLWEWKCSNYYHCVLCG